MKLSDNTDELRNYAAVNTRAVLSNCRIVRSYIPYGAGICAVIKADAYGHGAVECAHALEGDVDYFACADYFEAQELRERGIVKPILLLGYTPPSLARKLCALEITQAVGSLSYARALSDELAPGETLKVHLQLDTGMARLGISAAENATGTENAGFVNEIKEAIALPGLDFEGVFTHLASADDLTSDFTGTQLRAFYGALTRLYENGITFPYRHFANSAASCRRLTEVFEASFAGRSSGRLLFRPGIVLYGSYPSADIRSFIEKSGNKLEQAMTFYARVARIHTVKKGETVGYNRMFTAKRDTRVALICAGYADGIPRAFSNKVSLYSDCCRVIGNVCMDMLFLDITDAEIFPEEGCFVPLFGAGTEISADHLAALTGTISYELFCRISGRVRRIHI